MLRVRVLGLAGGGKGMQMPGGRGGGIHSLAFVGGGAVGGGRVGIVVGSVGGTNTGGWGCSWYLYGGYRCGYFAVVTRGRGRGSPEPPHGQNQSRQHHSCVKSIKPGPQS